MNRAIAIGVSISAVIILSGCMNSKEGYLAKGNKFYAAAKYEDAALNYRKATQKDPRFGEAYYRLGLVSIKLNQGQQAYDALFHAAQLMPANFEAKEKFADVCLSFYLADPNHPRALYTQLQTLSGELLANNKNSYEGLIIKGYLASSDRKPKDAILFFRRATDQDSKDAGVVTELVESLLQDGQTQAAVTLASNLIQTRKTSYGRVYDLMYDYYSRAGSDEDARQVLELKVANNPADTGSIVQLARHYHRIGNNDAMIETLRRLEDAKRFPDGQLAIGNFQLSLGNYADAIRIYRAGLESNPKTPGKLAYQKGILAALIGQGRKDEAVHLAETALKESPKDAEITRLHAGLLLETGKRENGEEAARELEALYSQNPNDVSLLFQLGQAYRLKGETASARRKLQEAIGKKSDFIQARYEVAELNLVDHLPNDALQQANQILMIHPSDRRARLLRTRALIGAGNVAAARAELLQLLKQSPEDSEAQLQLGFLALAERNYSQAIEILSKQREHGDIAAFVGLAKAYLHEKQIDAARATLAEGLKKWPDSTTLLEQLADTEVIAGHYDAAASDYQILLDRDPKSVELLRRLAELADRRGDSGSELRFAAKAREVAPNDAPVALLHAASLAKAGKTEEAKAEYLRAVKLNPDYAPALNNAAYFLAETGGDLDEALRLARHALEKAPGQPYFSDTIGYIYLKKGLEESAIQTLENVVRKYPTFGGCRYHLGLALYEKGDRNAARKELQLALTGNLTVQERQRVRELLNKIG